MHRLRGEEKRDALSNFIFLAEKCRWCFAFTTVQESHCTRGFVMASPSGCPEKPQYCFLEQAMQITSLLCTQPLSLMEVPESNLRGLYA